MAQIPYGYKIRNGMAEIDEDHAKQVRALFEGYRSGLSIQKAKDRSGIPMCLTSINKILQNPVYLGTDYYPAIIDSDTFQQAAEIRKKRFVALGNHRTTKPVKAEPIQTNFKLKKLPKRKCKDPAKFVASAYRCIGYSSKGNREITQEDHIRLKHWINGKEGD